MKRMMDVETSTYAGTETAERGAPQTTTSFSVGKGEARRGKKDKSVKYSRKKYKLTEEHEKFIAELSPEIAEKCRKAFTNVTATTNCAEKELSGLMKASGLEELPVLMMILEVTANAGQKIGTLIILASDTN